MPVSPSSSLPNSSEPSGCRSNDARLTSLSPSPSPPVPGASTSLSSRLASQVVYRTPELRLEILRWLDEWCLVKLLRVERSMTASVASVLFGTASLGMVSRLTDLTGSSRHAAVRATVRELDTSPVPSCLVYNRLDHLGPEKNPPARLEPRFFNWADITVEVTQLRRRFPNLRHITHHHPAHPMSDAYAIRLDEHGHIGWADIHTTVPIDVSLVPFVPPISLPIAPSITGVAIRQTLALKLVRGDGALAGTRAARVQHMQSIISWLYRNEDLDRRVTAIDHLSAGVSKDVHVDLATVLGFLRTRQINGCEPMRTLTIERQPGGVPLDTFHDVVAAMGSGVRELKVHDTFFHGFAQNCTALALIDTALPSLTRLNITFTIDKARPLASAMPLCGLAQVRVFQVEGLKELSRDETVRYLCEAGTRHLCVYQDVGLRSAKAAAKFGADVKKARTRLSG